MRSMTPAGIIRFLPKIQKPVSTTIAAAVDLVGRLIDVPDLAVGGDHLVADVHDASTDAELFVLCRARQPGRHTLARAGSHAAVPAAQRVRESETCCTTYRQIAHSG